ncbi:MAG: CIA30 family protein [Pseudomonadota bacterium]
MLPRYTLLLLNGLLGSAVVGQETVAVLFDFAGPNAASEWQIVNDGVMGGRSTSQASIVNGGDLRFTGNLSLANNGGFASVRSRPKTLGLQRGQTLVLRALGDGRRYTFNLYTPNRRTAYSYQMKFETVPGQWAEVRLPLSQFVAHSFGRPLPQDRLEPTRVQSVGVLLGDKRAGPFEILIDFIGIQ